MPYVFHVLLKECRDESSGFRGLGFQGFGSRDKGLEDRISDLCILLRGVVLPWGLLLVAFVPELYRVHSP